MPLRRTMTHRTNRACLPDIATTPLLDLVNQSQGRTVGHQQNAEYHERFHLFPLMQYANSITGPYVRICHMYERSNFH
mgnify:CR=1 FL=1